MARVLDKLRGELSSSNEKLKDYEDTLRAIVDYIDSPVNSPLNKVFIPRKLAKDILKKWRVKK